MLEFKKVDETFREILYEIENSSDSYFITGKAGTGKSTLLNYFRTITSKKTVVLAPTGIAALHVKGQTIHSFFKFKPRIITPDMIKGKRKKSFKKLDTIIIDEISMVRADVMDGIDLFLRYQREDDSPFGGIQMIFFGDLFQLPPVVGKGQEKEIFESMYENPYFFGSNAFREFKWFSIELTKVFRQKDPFFIKLLDKIRINQADETDLSYINEICCQQDNNEQALTLTTINYKANLINQQKLNELPDEPALYIGKPDGDFPTNAYPTQEILKIKLGAQVMAVRNDPDGAFVNGTIGIVSKLLEDSIEVTVKDAQAEKKIVIGQMTWERIKYVATTNPAKPFKQEVIGTFTQLPIKMAWAMTIHKSQGKTFDFVNIDLGRGAFEYGQTYVALSRCRSLAGINLTNQVRLEDIQVDEKVTDFYHQYIQ